MKRFGQIDLGVMKGTKLLNLKDAEGKAHAYVCIPQSFVDCTVDQNGNNHYNLGINAETVGRGYNDAVWKRQEQEGKKVNRQIVIDHQLSISYPKAINEKLVAAVKAQILATEESKAQAVQNILKRNARQYEGGMVPDLNDEKVLMDEVWNTIRMKGRCGMLRHEEKEDSAAVAVGPAVAATEISQSDIDGAVECEDLPF